MKIIELEVEILERSEIDTIGQKAATKEVSRCAINIDCVEHFWESKEDNELYIFFKSGERIISKSYTYDEFKKIIMKESILSYSEMFTN